MPIIISVYFPIIGHNQLLGDLVLQNIRETSKVELICTVTAHLLSQPSGSERMLRKILLLLSWIKKYIYSLGTHTEDLLHNGISNP